ncbi:Uma2 family endonuclease [Synechocystis sp. CS-94]|nr:hypothetical protein D082_28450 [Synechocystis sp. PCC 6714]MCT0253606.1 Uma2 family endonuclease [Synechocystis sp. CS-94]
MIREEAKFYESRTDTVLNPTLIVEVLSPFTSEYGRGEKFRAYLSVTGFREYWLVEQS